MNTASPTKKEPADESERAVSKGAGAADVLLCYAPDCEQDRVLVDRLMEHLALLLRERKIRAWHDGMLVPGAEREAEVRRHLDEAQVILLLVSASFVASDTCYERLATRAMERRAAGEARVIPIVIRPCDWQSAPFGALPALPPGDKAIAQFEDADVAFTNVAKGLRAALEESATQAETSAPGGIVTTPPAPRDWKRHTAVFAALAVIALAGAGLAAQVLGARFGADPPLPLAVPARVSASSSALPSSSAAPAAPLSASVPPGDSSSASSSPPQPLSASNASDAAPTTTVAARRVLGGKAPGTTNSALSTSAPGSPSAAAPGTSMTPPGSSDGMHVGVVKTGNESSVAVRAGGAKKVDIGTVETGNKSPVTIDGPR